MPLFRQPLFLPKLVARHLRVGPVPQAHAEVLHAWAGTIRDASITKQKETETRFEQQIIAW